MRRAQVLAAVVVAVLAVAGATYAERQVGTRSLGTAAPGERAPSGAWFCPHGGGEQDWEVALQIANPGPDAATVRIRSISSTKPEAPLTQTIEPGALAVVPVDGIGRERSSMVEWFGQWVAVGWVSHAGGDERGVAAEPCAPAAGERWLLPDGSTATKPQNDYVIVMNPSARDAVVSFTLLSERKEPIQKSELTDVVIKPFHSMAVPLNDKVLGEETVSTIVDAAAGRVVAASLGVWETGGIRSTLGYLGDPPATVVFPGGDDAGRTQLTVMSTSLERVQLTAERLGAEQVAPFAGVADAAPPSESARTFTATTAEPTSVVFTSAAPGIAAVRRTFGVASDQGSTIGGSPSAGWLVLPAVSGSPSHPSIALANPSEVPAEVRLSLLGTGEGTEPGSVAITVTVPPRSSVLAPSGFVEAAPGAAVLAVASSGTFVPAAVSYSRGKEGFATFAVALGIEVPVTWVPT